MEQWRNINWPSSPPSQTKRAHTSIDLWPQCELAKLNLWFFFMCSLLVDGTLLSVCQPCFSLLTEDSRFSWLGSFRELSSLLHRKLNVRSLSAMACDIEGWFAIFPTRALGLWDDSWLHANVWPRREAGQVHSVACEPLSLAVFRFCVLGDLGGHFPLWFPLLF